jgi:hypothetical protein
VSDRLKRKKNGQRQCRANQNDIKIVIRSLHDELYYKLIL